MVAAQLKFRPRASSAAAAPWIAHRERGSALMMRGSYQNGWWLSLIVTVLMLARFGSAALSKGFKLMPGGMVIILSVIVLAALLSQRVSVSK